MATLVIFGAALCAVLFFILEILFKILASIFSAMFESIDKLLPAWLTMLGAFVLYILHRLVETLFDGGWKAILLIIVIFVFGSVIGALLTVGAYLFEIAFIVAVYAIELIISAFEWLSNSCDKVYSKCLATIFRRLEQY